MDHDLRGDLPQTGDRNPSRSHFSYPKGMLGTDIPVVFAVTVAAETTQKRII